MRKIIMFSMLAMSKCIFRMTMRTARMSDLGMDFCIFQHFFLVIDICPIPKGFYEYFQYAVEMAHENKKNQNNEKEYSYKYKFDTCNRDVRKNSRYNKWEQNEHEYCQNRPNVHKNERDIEFEGNTHIVERHCGWWYDGIKGFFVLKYDEKTSIGKEDIYDHCQEKIKSHSQEDIPHIGNPKKPQQKYRKGEYRQELEKCSNIVRFEYR